MFKVEYKHKSVQKRLVVVLALLCLIVCSVNVQFYLEGQVAVNIVNHTTTCMSKQNQPENYFNMSLTELMEVAVAS